MYSVMALRDEVTCMETGNWSSKQANILIMSAMQIVFWLNIR